MSGWRVATIALVVGVVATALPSVAWAGTPDDPELTDACGPAEVTGSGLVPEATAPWTDVCGAWFETLTGQGGPPALKVSLAAAGDIAARPTPASYYLSWRVGDCLYSVQKADPGTFPGELRELRYRCGPAYDTVPCDSPLPLQTCTVPRPVEQIPLPEDAFSAVGNVLSVTLLFDGGLAHHADDFAPGDVLERLYAHANGPHAGGSYCVGAECGAIGGDTASGGRAYTMEQGEGQGPAGPLVPVLTPCMDGSVDTASAAQPHVSDPEGDTPSNVVAHPEADGPGWDLRALWFSRAQDGVNLHILPAGPATAATTAYIVDLGEQSVRVEGQPDGTWQASVHEDNDFPTPDSAGTATSVTVDATTGEVAVGLPQALLPAGDVLRVAQFHSYYIVGGEAPRGGQGMTVLLGVDNDRGARICDATLS